MKKIFYFTLATFALLAVSSCEKNLDIPQKGVTAIETFYKTDEDCEAALVAAYAQFAENVVSQNGSSIYTHYKACLNNCGDDMYAAGSNFGDNAVLPLRPSAAWPKPVRCVPISISS